MSTVLTSKMITAGRIACRILMKRGKGAVCGVFSKALYVRTDDGMLLFHDAKWGIVPFGIAVSDIEKFLAEVDAAVGQAVEFSPESIAIGEKMFEILLTEAKGEAFTTAKKPSKERIEALKAYVLAHGSSHGMLEIISENRGGARDTIAALTAGNASAAVKLLGLGRGLTPSGDDFLCGFMAVLDAAKWRFPNLVRGEILPALKFTTDISAAYINGVIEREYYTIYDYAARALLCDKPFEKYADFVLEMGASSGTDTMVGAIVAADMMLKE